MRILAILSMMFVASVAWADEPVYVVTHIDLTSNNTAPGIALIKQLAADTAKEKNCERFEILQQEGRPNHFTVVGVWKDRKAFEEHDASPWVKQFREKIQPMIGSPWDERLHQLVKP